MVAARVEVAGLDPWRLGGELWSAGYSLRYIARAERAGAKTAEKLVGRKLLAQRETWRGLADAEGRR